MLRFLRHLLLMVLMLSLTFLPIFTSGEMGHIDYVIRRQYTKDNNILFGLGYTDRNRYYKTQCTIIRNPKVLALGSSRVMQIRDEFFENPQNFYNAGGAANYPLEMQCFLEQMPKDNKIELIIISLDQWIFNVNYTGKLSEPDVATFIDPSLNETLDFKNAMEQIIDDYIEQKLSIFQLLIHNNRIGVNAKVNGNGFLKDGSYYYGKRFSQKNDPDESYFSDTFQRIEDGNARFEYGEEINQETIEQMEIFLAYCKANGIKVIAFEPPFAASVVEKLEVKGDQYQYMDEIPSKMSNIFEKYQFEFYDYSDVTNLGCGADSFFVDGFHGSEVVYIKMFQDMIQQGSCLEAYCDIDKLIRLYESRDSDVAVYEIIEDI